MRKLSFLLAFLLALTAVVPAHAETMMESELALPPDESPIVNVTVPATGRIILNPYGMSVETSDGTSSSQVICETMTITNESEVPVAVSASVTGHISEHSSMEFASAPPPSDAREKAVFLYAEFQNEDGVWQEGYTGTENQILVSAEASEEKDVLTLAAGPSEGVFRVSGATSVSPDDPWCSDDAVSVTVSFTFEAVLPETATVEESPAEESSTTPETPEVPETPDVPETPEDPDTPAVPETPEEPETPEVPETPAVPETPDVPGTPGEVELPEEPEIPEAETPEEPGTPEGSETPEVPETP